MAAVEPITLPGALAEPIALPVAGIEVHPLVALAYLISGVLFILALRGLSSPESSRRGNRLGMLGMLIAVGTTMITHDAVALPKLVAAIAIGGVIGFFVARRIAMTAMPQLVAAFHSLVGLAAVVVGAAAYLSPESFGIVDALTGQIHNASRIELGLGVAIGAITFSGSVIAFLKLNGNMSGKPILLPARHVINLGTLAAILGLIGWFYAMDVPASQPWLFWTVLALSFVIGFLLIVPIGGADMPVVVSMLNSYSGWAAAAMGFTLQNTAMIITGALVGSSGAILSYIMCKAMNRSFISVIAGGFGAEAAAAGGEAKEQRPWKRGSAEDAAFLMKQADSVIIVPGYGMAVSQAQHALREMGDMLKAAGVSVKYAIHPVAGRMPGHMNVLLAEANVPYDEVFELEDINSAFAQTDVAFVIGANDVTNPAAKTDKTSPIYGMPILDVVNAKTVLFVKRSMGGVGYAGVDNDVFYQDNTMMLLADAKKMVEEIVKSLGH
jgi:NAD(P) transhydrogenase subunit beta